MIFKCIQNFFTLIFEIINAIINRGEKGKKNPSKSLATDPSTNTNFLLALNPSYLLVVPAKALTNQVSFSLITKRVFFFSLVLRTLCLFPESHSWELTVNYN